MKTILFASIGIIALSITACSKGNEEKSPPAIAPKAEAINIDTLKKAPFHGDMKTSAPAVPGTSLLDGLKNNRLDVASTKTIGEAFDGYKYAIKKEWRETSTENGPYYIDYICWFQISPDSSATLKDGVMKRGLEIKFAVQKDGDTSIAMARRLDVKSDGNLYATPLLPPEIRKTVTAIYENREIAF